MSKTKSPEKALVERFKKFKTDVVEASHKGAGPLGRVIAIGSLKPGYTALIYEGDPINGRDLAETVNAIVYFGRLHQIDNGAGYEGMVAVADINWEAKVMTQHKTDKREEPSVIHEDSGSISQFQRFSLSAIGPTVRQGEVLSSEPSFNVGSFQFIQKFRGNVPGLVDLADLARDGDETAAKLGEYAVGPGSLSQVLTEVTLVGP